MKSLASLRQMASLVGRMPHMPHVDVASIRSHVPKLAPKTLLTRDYPEVLLLYGWLGFAACIGVYSMKKVLFDNDAGSYMNVNMRGDIDRQFGEKVATEDGGQASSVSTPWSTKHTLWWKLAQVKTDDNGANIGVLWDNRARPHQYSKPGEGGVGSGLTMAGL